MQHVFTLHVDWNGSQLIARTELGDGWRLLADSLPVKLLSRSIHAGEVRDLTAFELGVFLAEACRPFTLQWDQVRERDSMLWELVPDGPRE